MYGDLDKDRTPEDHLLGKVGEFEIPGYYKPEQKAARAAAKEKLADLGADWDKMKRRKAHVNLVVGRKGYSLITRRVDAPAGMILKAILAGREESLVKHKAAHRARYARCKEGMDRAGAKVSPEKIHQWTLNAITPDLVSEALGIGAKKARKVSALIQQQLTTERSGNYARERLKKQGESAEYWRGHRNNSISEALYEVRGKVWPMTEKARRGHWTRGDERTEEERAAYDAAMDKISGEERKIAHAIADRVLAKIVKEFGVKTDPAKGWAKVEELSLEQAKSRHERRAAGQDLKPYDKDKDLCRLGRVFDVLDRSLIPRVSITTGIQGRAYYSRGAIALNSEKPIPHHNSDRTAYHEYGHAIEKESQGITEAANALRDERGKNDRLKAMSWDNAGQEKTHADEWESSYIGKWYGHMSATEVLSMGFERLMLDPRKFYETDREHFLFTVAAVTGQFSKGDKKGAAK